MKMKVEMLDGDVYQVEAHKLDMDDRGNLVARNYSHDTVAVVAAGEWLIAGEWLKVQRIEINAAKGNAVKDDNIPF